MSGDQLRSVGGGKPINNDEEKSMEHTRMWILPLPMGRFFNVRKPQLLGVHDMAARWGGILIHHFKRLPRKGLPFLESVLCLIRNNRLVNRRL